MPVPATTASDYLQYLYQALTSEEGICLQVDEGERKQAVQRLYAARREAKDPQLDILGFVMSPTDENQLWIMKKKPNGST